MFHTLHVLKSLSCCPKTFEVCKVWIFWENSLGGFCAKRFNFRPIMKIKFSQIDAKLRRPLAQNFAIFQKCSPRCRGSWLKFLCDLIEYLQTTNTFSKSNTSTNRYWVYDLNAWLTRKIHALHEAASCVPRIFFDVDNFQVILMDTTLLETVYVRRYKGGFFLVSIVSTRRLLCHIAHFKIISENFSRPVLPRI